MAKSNGEIETVIFQALAHPMRRTIITILGGNTKGLLYTELITELGLPTGKMNYHIEQLEGLILKNEENRYVLTSLGVKALNQLNQLKAEVTNEDMKFLSIAEQSRRGSLEPMLKGFLRICVFGSIAVIVLMGVIAYGAYSEGAAPLFLWVILPIFMAIEVGVAIVLIRALRNIPPWLRRLEKKVIETS
ncbi:MAG: helix-turn-helix domain-containing protein [Candidatus Bathyarchaeota archaeon]|nr:helix-turn-helix domain-containing protein [Candidatus Bathyarchaeota archaeon]